MQRIGILHPGEMGISIAVAAQKSGNEVYWASAGRGDASRQRAAQFGLRDAVSVANLVAECSIILSVCPPHAAEAVAEQVAANAFTGLYVDANAIAPQRAVRMNEAMTAAGISFVDGGIVGDPAWKPGVAWLYLSGPRAQNVADCFSGSPLGTRVLGRTIGSASALKIGYAAYTKGVTALLCSILATAEQFQVREALQEHWAMEDSSFPERTERRIRRAPAKAWRFIGEMAEIAATFRAAGIPGEFHEAAADIFRRLAHFKDAAPPPRLDDVLAALTAAGDEPPFRTM